MGKKSAAAAAVEPANDSKSAAKKGQETITLLNGVQVHPVTHFTITVAMDFLLSFLHRFGSTTQIASSYAGRSARRGNRSARCL